MGPPGWQNPITAQPGQTQLGVDPKLLLPCRRELVKARLEFQRSLIVGGLSRFTPIQVTPDGVIYDGHHAVRAAAEENSTVDVSIVSQILKPTDTSILNLPVR